MTALTRYLVDPHNFQTFSCGEGEIQGKWHYAKLILLFYVIIVCDIKSFEFFYATSESKRLSQNVKGEFYLNLRL
jgi:hypothetical protein